MTSEGPGGFFALGAAGGSGGGVQRKTLAARSLYEARREMQARLPVELTIGPALDILLHLYLADGGREDKEVLLELTRLTPTVTARWLAHLQKSGLIDVDGSTLALSPSGSRLVTIACEALLTSQRRVADMLGGQLPATPS